MPRGPGIPEPVRSAVGPYVPPHGSVSMLRANHPGRFVALLIAASGEAAFVAKVALDEGGVDALEREARSLSTIARSLPTPLEAPRLVHSAPGLVVTEAIPWIVRSRPWRFPPDVAYALGRWFRTGDNAVHGDVAPWNLLKTRNGWVLVDWENASTSANPFDDVFHYLIQAYALLNRPRKADLIAGLREEGEVGESITRYAQGAGVSTDEIRDLFVEHLEKSRSSLSPDRPDGARGIKARTVLLDVLR
jgi:hypothetical protein